MKVREAGLKDVHCASPMASLSEIATMMKRHNVGVIPICEERKLIGLLTDRDLVVSCMAADMNPGECQAREFMTSAPLSVTLDTDIEEAAWIMGREQIHRLPVIEAGDLVGMISLGDIATALFDDDGLVAETLRKISTPTHQPV